MVTNVSLMADADDGTHYARMGVGNTWEISVRSSPFSCEPKTALKNKVFLKFYLSKKNYFTKKQKENTKCKTKEVLFKLKFRFLGEHASKAVGWLWSMIGLVVVRFSM